MDLRIHVFLFANQYSRPAQTRKRVLGIPLSQQNHHHINREKRTSNHKNSTKVLQRKQLEVVVFNFITEKYKMAVGDRRPQVRWVQEERPQGAMLALFCLGTGF